MPQAAELKVLLDVQLPLLIYKMNGDYYAEAPHFGVWDCAPSREQALEGAVQAVILLLESAEELGGDEEFLREKGFAKRGSSYTPLNANQVIAERVMELDWKDDDPDKLRFSTESLGLAKVYFVETAPDLFSEPADSKERAGVASGKESLPLGRSLWQSKLHPQIPAYVS
ncbi:MAG: hypothetical protein B1H03_07315 [Planctomycetales bacterium 4484_113]|nr:MAG: hypothetical protein B1H03_07315 [Planctomycetales bacterium 4484_113]